MYMPGRLRTGSRPSSTWISSPVYLDACAISVHLRAALDVREGLNDHRLRQRSERALLDHLAALAAARGDLFRVRFLGVIAPTLLALDLEHVALAPGDEADHLVAGPHLDHGDAAARALELRDLVGLA